MSRLLPSLPDATPEDRDPRVVGVHDDEAEAVLAALGSETARDLLSALHEEPTTTSELADELDTSLQNVQYHLSKLSDADVVGVVDTTYSEKGREMNVYAPADEPLVLFAGREEESTGIKTALKRLLGGYGLIGLAAAAAQRLLSVPVPEGTDAAAPRRVSDGGGGDDATTEDAADGAGAEPEGGVEYVFGDGGAADLLADHALSLLEPGVVFFLGAALVFTVIWVYRYRRGRRGV